MYLVAMLNLDNLGVVPEPGTERMYVIRCGENKSARSRRPQETLIRYLVERCGWDGQPAEELAEEMIYQYVDKIEIGELEEE